MKIGVMLVLEEGGRTVPLCRTRRQALVWDVARAGLADVRAVAAAEQDEVLAALLGQEADRLERALATLGLGDSGERQRGVRTCSA